MKYLLGIDFGGGSSKTTLISAKGTVLAENTVEYPTLHPTPGGCEQRAEDWVQALCENTAAILRLSGADPRDIAAVAVDSATHTFLPCDGDFRPLRAAIHWTDSRSAADAAALNRELGDLIYEKTFHRPGTIWTLPQLIWLKKTEPDLYERIRYIFFEKDYLRFFLTGKYYTDYIEASGSMLFDCRKRTWDEELCAIAGLPTSALPPVISPLDNAGSVTADAAAATGLCEGTPVICGTTDTALEVFASGAVRPGDMTVKLATAGRICVITEKATPDAQLVTYPHVVPGLWYPGTATKAAASSLRWYRDTFGGDYASIDAEAMRVPVGSEGLLYHPYINGELTPYGDPALCGSFTGIRASHGRGHFNRAVMEGVAFSLLDSKLYLDSLHIPHADTATVIGGGAKGKVWRQILSDTLGMPLRMTENSDSSLGSAMLAGVAAGVFADAADAVRVCVRETGVTDPIPENTEIYRRLFQKYKRIHDALCDVYHEF